MDVVKASVSAAAARPDATINFWKDPNGESCCICGGEAAVASGSEAEAEAEEEHTELTCPYNYLAPAAAGSYVPCRARFAVWRGDVGASPSASEHRRFLRRFVRVSNLPGSCRPADLVGLLAGFGPLRMWHVAMDGPGACKGFAAVVFERREHADEAIEGLNCFSFGGRSLQVDWAYPSATLE